jgi:hypothetical protein
MTAIISSDGSADEGVGCGPSSPLYPGRLRAVRSASGEDVQIVIESSDMNVALARQLSKAVCNIYGISQVSISKKGIIAPS